MLGDNLSYHSPFEEVLPVVVARSEQAAQAGTGLLPTVRGAPEPNR